MPKKYIDADLLRKEIERRIKKYRDDGFGCHANSLEKLLAFLDSLPEQKETTEDDYCEEVFLCSKHFG